MDFNCGIIELSSPRIIYRMAGPHFYKNHSRQVGSYGSLVYFMFYNPMVF
jgi:hypothetical protein